MKRILVVVLLGFCLFLSPTEAKPKKKPCKPSLVKCPPEGCSKDNHHDPDLNKLKNLKSSTKPVEKFSLDEMTALEQAVIDAGYHKGEPRKPTLSDLGEGRQIRVVGMLLAVKKEGGESCNCGLSEVDVTTDNHLVLVNPKVVTDIPLPEPATANEIKETFHEREKQSVTAEFTPRVRAKGHPNFTRRVLQFQKLNKSRQGAIWVRVTGQLMFDSEHFGESTPVRLTSWEIHPILKFEFCPTNKTCPETGNANWVNLDSVP